MFFKPRLRIAVWVVSVSIGSVIVLLSVLLGLYKPQAPYLIPLSQTVNNTMAFGIIISFFCPAIVEINNSRWSRQIDRTIPTLLRDISEAVQSGIPLTRTLEEASQRDYGPLTQELKHVVSMFIFGASWEESLMSLTQRIKRPSVLRLSTILIEAHQTGGKMVEVLDASVDLFSSLDEFKEEQHNNMRPYILTIYMATIIFLIIAYIVLHQFLTPLYETTSNPLVSESGFLTGVLDINYYNSLLFWASIIESIFGGLIAGKIAEGITSAGLIHSVILCITTLLFFNISSIGVP